MGGASLDSMVLDEVPVPSWQRDPGKYAKGPLPVLIPLRKGMYFPYGLYQAAFFH